VQFEGGDDPLVVQASTTLVSNHKELKDVTYTVGSRLAPGGDTPLTEAQRRDTDVPLPPEMQQYTALPDDFPSDVRSKAREITDGKGTPVDRARALEQFFLDPAERFQYSLDVELGPEAQTQSAIREFLQSRTGFCVQFAGSFAAMARAVGLPARVAVGYTPGTYDGTAGVFRVTSEDAHAWGEVWLAGLGWTRFEPTPASNLPGAARLPGRDVPAASATPVPSAPPTNATPSVPTTAGTGAAPGTAEVAIDPPASEQDRRDGFSFSWMLLVVLLMGAVAGLAAVAAAIVVAKRRRRQRRHARPDPAAAITGAWEEVLDRLGEAGVARLPTRTPLELAAEASPKLPENAGAPLHELADTYTATRYAATAPDTALARKAWRDAGAVNSALRAGAGLRERLRRRLDPSSLRR
jgi:transglutaminase-like putative cysteine protease